MNEPMSSINTPIREKNEFLNLVDDFVSWLIEFSGALAVHQRSVGFSALASGALCHANLECRPIHDHRDRCDRTFSSPRDTRSDRGTSTPRSGGGRNAPDVSRDLMLGSCSSVPRPRRRTLQWLLSLSTRHEGDGHPLLERATARPRPGWTVRARAPILRPRTRHPRTSIGPTGRAGSARP